MTPDEARLELEDARPDLTPGQVVDLTQTLMDVYDRGVVDGKQAAVDTVADWHRPA